MRALVFFPLETEGQHCSGRKVCFLERMQGNLHGIWGTLSIRRGTDDSDKWNGMFGDFALLSLSFQEVLFGTNRRRKWRKRVEVVP